MPLKNAKIGVLAGCGLAATMMSYQQTFAATIFNTGFEAPTYAAGSSLAGQPVAPPKFTTNKTALAVGTVTDSVQTYTGIGVTQTQPNNLQVAQLVSQGIDSDSISYVLPQLSSFSPVGQGTPVVNIGIDILSQVGPSGSGNPGFGITAFDGGNNPFFDLYVGASGAVFFDSNGSGSTFTSGYVASPTAFTRYDVSLDYALQSYTITANGTTFVGSGTFLDTTFSTVAFNAVSVTGTSSGIGLYDGFTINAVPEPTTASLVVGGLAVAGLRRRRRDAR